MTLFTCSSDLRRKCSQRGGKKTDSAKGGGKEKKGGNKTEVVMRNCSN